LAATIRIVTVRTAKRLVYENVNVARLIVTVMTWLGRCERPALEERAI
jgi:hypothetical protein